MFDQLIRENPNNANAHNGKAVAFDHSGNHQAAQDIYKTALSLEPKSLPITNNLAMSLILNHQPEQAILLLEPLLELYADNATLRHNLALAYGLTGNKDKALKLNITSMTKQQAEENLRFYQYVAKTKQGEKALSRQIGFKEAKEEEVKVEEPVKLENKQEIVIKEEVKEEMKDTSSIVETATDVNYPAEPENTPQEKPLIEEGGFMGYSATYDYPSK